VINDKTGDLRETIQNLQTLQREASKSANTIKESLRNSIQSLQILAGLHTTLLEKENPKENEPLLLITIIFRLSYLPTSELQLPQLRTCSTLSFQTYIRLYNSPNHIPEIPPPVFA
jgi:hypothetical protein